MFYLYILFLYLKYFIMATVDFNWRSFEIPEYINPKLIDLIINTESMNNQETKEWLEQLPLMSKESIDRLFNILKEEENKLNALEEKYQNEIKKFYMKNI